MSKDIMKKYGYEFVVNLDDIGGDSADDIYVNFEKKVVVMITSFEVNTLFGEEPRSEKIQDELQKEREEN